MKAFRLLPLASLLALFAGCATADYSPTLAGSDSLPKVIHREPATYPPELRARGITGYAIVGFDVDPAGSVVNVRALTATEPAFAEAAVAAVTKWTFEPAREGGSPVRTRLETPIEFAIGDRDRVHAAAQAAFAQLRVPSNHPTSPAAVVLQPVYPLELRRDHITGSATVELTINPYGRVAHARLVAADRPEFGYAALAAAENTQVAALPRPLVQTVTVRFDEDANPDRAGVRILRRLENRPPAHPLDAPLRTVSGPVPRFPLTERANAGQAEIECVVLKNGRADLPRIVSASSPAFGFAAAHMARGWTFTPPMVNGHAAEALIRMTFTFRRDAIAARVTDPGLALE